jgi:hypothetical protein
MRMDIDMRGGNKYSEFSKKSDTIQQGNDRNTHVYTYIHICEKTP